VLVSTNSTVKLTFSFRFIHQNFLFLVGGNGSCLLRWWLLPTSSYNEEFNFAFQFIQVAMKHKVFATNDSKHIVTAIFFFSSSINK